MLWAGCALTVLTTAATARASETPLYQPAPAWIAAAPAAPTGEGSPPVMLVDMQHRIEDGRLWSYARQQTRIATSEMLSQAATLTLPWAPDKGDLIVHDLAILRDGKRIDLLAQGQKFTVLRREESLEQRELTGILTATMAVEGLQVGDVLDLGFSTTERDRALGGRVQDVTPLIAAPARIGAGRVRFSWPTAAAPKWKLLADGVTATPVKNGAYTELTIALPLAKPKEMPDDAPSRYRHPPLIELATFADWADVSRTFASLYASDGLIAPGSALAGEVAAIQTAEATPIGRAQRALEVVQDKIRYLAVGMDGGNYVPQKPARTWDVRYGDCKAKTLLLLAMLKAMGIEAEAVVANVGEGDFVPERLPSAAAFNHVFVRATIDGQSLWLDGTGSNARMADIRDTPPAGYVLPLRAGGATPERIVTRANARPMIDLTIDADESGAVDLPSPLAITATIHGQLASMLRMAKSQLGAEEQRDLLNGMLQQWIGEGQFADVTLTADGPSGDMVVRATGVTTTPWRSEDRRRKRSLTYRYANFGFAPDRSRPEWTGIPVVVPAPTGIHSLLRVKLPEGGRGMTLEGTGDADLRVAGFVVKRTTRLSNGVLTIDERVDSTGGEIPAAQVAAERDAVATMRAQLPQLVAPADTPRRWTLTPAAIEGSGQVKAIRAVFAKAIADDVEEPSGYTSRATFESAIGDRRAALADLTKVIGIQPSVDLYLQRSQVHARLGDPVQALADAERARAIDPASFTAIGQVAQMKAESGDLAGGLALLDQRIALGGESRVPLRRMKATLLGDFGAAAEAVALYDTLIGEKPGSPLLLNGRCWVKGTRAVMLDTALKDCTAAIELSDDTAAALDSRAMVWYRLGRYAEAMTDVDTVLADHPDHASTRYLRAAILKATKRDGEAAGELAIARRLSPTIDREYARYGFKL
ncbi:DUF3857 domain-containing protein [Sphingomonas sp. Leaf4]|uniref:DUF3857 domain-containing protein n=1 Tax=Sphingomonas sp. Leaf4 TaxID=2876553 RepID=UPI001E289F93|nr:DUF3857 domain-containing protein [Sphingomonas sp. Leaf4]